MTVPDDNPQQPGDLTAGTGPGRAQSGDKAKKDVPPLPASPSGRSEAGSSAGEVKPPVGSNEMHAAGNDVATAGDVGESAEQISDEDLPEWEPLTPELVEDEAIRGDFMLRWAVVLLAFLLGCTKISSTATLVHVKTGQYLASHVWWPPATDVFSYTAADRPWVNLSWLFDLLLAGVFAVGGAGGLSLLTAVLAATIFYFVVHTTKPEISTWWGSVCAAMALLVCYPQFTVEPELITLLGVSWTIWFLQRWKNAEKDTVLWPLVPAFVLWSNLDGRMFLGLLALLLYAIGASIGRMLGRTSLSASRLRNLWMVAGACVAAALLNPFGWRVLASPLTLYGVEYPGFRDHYGARPTIEEVEFFPLLGSRSGVFWKSAGNQQVIASLILFGMAVVTMVLNRARTDIGHVLLFFGFAGLSLLASHELAVATLAATVIGSVNAQEWYRANFRQTYTIETAEVLFSRGGRAATVLALFAFAFLAISGRLAGADNRRTGLGLSPELRQTIDSMRTELADSFDDRPFHFRFSQGDILIWLGQKVFVDNRVALYGGQGDANLLVLHDRTRQSLRNRTSELTFSGDTTHWKDVFNRYKVTHVLPRMNNETSPDYFTYFDLYTSPSWQLCRLGGRTAVFYRTDLQDPKLLAYRKKHRVDVVNEAFTTSAEESQIRVDWAHPRSFYQKYLSLPNVTHNDAVQRAWHYISYLELGAAGQLPLSLDEGLAIATLAIRSANEGLAEDPQSAAGFLALGSAYFSLMLLEDQIGADQGVRYQNDLRYFQVLNSLNQAAIIDPDNPQVQRRLLNSYRSRQKVDLTLRALSRLEELTKDRFDLTDKELAQRHEDTLLLQELRNAVQQVTQQVEQALQQNVNRFALVQQLYAAGFVLKALEVFDEDPVATFDNPNASRLKAVLLMESGRIQEAADAYDDIQSLAAGSGASDWQSPAAIAKLANGNHLQAVTLWSEQLTAEKATAMDGLLSTLPLTPTPLFLFGQGQDLWPIHQTSAVADSLFNSSSQAASLLWNIAMAHLENGRIAEAAAALKSTVEEDPETALRPLTRTYLRLTTGETIEAEPPSNLIPVTPDIFAPDSDQKNASDAERGNDFGTVRVAK